MRNISIIILSFFLILGKADGENALVDSFLQFTNTPLSLLNLAELNSEFSVIRVDILLS